MTTDHELPDDEHIQRFAEALHAEVDQLEVSSDSLARIRARTATSGGGASWRWIAPFAAAAVVAVVAAGAILLPDRDQHTVAPPVTSISPTPTTPTTPSPTITDLCTGPMAAVPSYFVGTFEGRSLLYRSFFWGDRCAPTEQARVARVVQQAVANMSRASEVGRKTLWPSDLQVIAYSRQGDTGTIRLNDDPLGDSTLAIQQLVYTVTAADPSIKVMGIELPSGSDDMLHGRAPASEVLAPVWLTEASAKTTKKGYVIHLAGTASVFEANLNWQITDESGTVVDSGHAMTPEAAPARGPWQATSKALPKGHEYTVTAYEASPQDGRMTWPDSRTTP